MTPSSDNNDRTRRECNFVDKVGKRIAGLIKEPDLKFVKGEVVIFIGYYDKKGRIQVKYFLGTKASSLFKEKLCEESLDILLNDARISLSRGNQEEDLDTNSH